MHESRHEYPSCQKLSLGRIDQILAVAVAGIGVVYTWGRKIESCRINARGFNGNALGSQEPHRRHLYRAKQSNR